MYLLRYHLWSFAFLLSTNPLWNNVAVTWLILIFKMEISDFCLWFTFLFLQDAISRVLHMLKNFILASSFIYWGFRPRNTKPVLGLVLVWYGTILYCPVLGPVLGPWNCKKFSFSWQNCLIWIISEPISNWAESRWTGWYALIPYRYGIDFFYSFEQSSTLDYFL